MVRPVGYRAIVELIEEEVKTSGGIHLPGAKPNYRKAKVLALGQPKYLENGSSLPIPVAVGDIVYFSVHHGWELADKKWVANIDELLAAEPVTQA